MFSIKFVTEPYFSPNRNETVVRGEIRLDNFSEYFESSLSFWKIEDYENQWLEGAKRLHDFEASAFITDFYNPDSANFIVWWTAWKLEDKVYLQNQLLLLNEIQAPFETDNPYKHITERATESEDGHKISEWQMALRDFERFCSNS